MRVFIAVIILIFSLQSWAKADDIRDFQIEGMSIGDSLLDFFSEEEIKDNSKAQKIYKPFGLTTFTSSRSAELKSKLKQYDYMQIAYMLDDKNYIIIGMSAAISKNNFEINACKKEAKKISNEIKELFGESVKYQHDKMKKAAGDRSGKSISDTRYYIFKDGSFVGVRCSDWSKEMNLKDRLSVDLASKKFHDIMKKAHPQH